MKTTKRLWAIAMAVMTLAACQKENSNVLILEAESMHNGTKMAVDGNSSYWANGDWVRIYSVDNNADYGTSREINLSISGQATLDVSDIPSLRTPIIGLYPSSIHNGRGTNFINVAFPATYAYGITYVNSVEKQNLQTPMVAYTESGNRMRFKHLTGAVTVEITNDFGIDVKVTDITVSSNLYQLNGDRYVYFTDITSDPLWVDTVQSDNPDERQVQMTFGGPELIIPSGQTKQVQVPVLPVGKRNKFTVSVTVQNKDDAEMEYTFTKEQASKNALLRAQIGYAPAKFGGKFATGTPGQYVRFAPGNLQYNAYYNTWRFAKHQYDVIGNAAGNTTSVDRETQPNWIDLFGYGTSGNDEGQNAYQPWATSTTPTDYYSNFLTDDYGHPDWGVENSITNGVIDWTAEWRTPDWSEITYNNTIAIANVNNIFGLIILPEGYNHPLEGAIITLPDEGYNDFNATQWEKMEVAGAIFLPAAGKRNGTTVTDVYTTGYYWSNSGYSDGTANALKIMSDIWNFNNVGEDASNGFAVRLVRVN